MDEVKWHAWLDSNQRLPASETGALFPELQAYCNLVALRESNSWLVEDGLGFEPRTSGVRVRRNCQLCYPPMDSLAHPRGIRATRFWSSARRFHLISLECSTNISPRPRRIARRMSETVDRTERCGGDPEISVRRAAYSTRNRRFLLHWRLEESWHAIRESKLQVLVRQRGFEPLKSCF